MTPHAAIDFGKLECVPVLGSGKQLASGLAKDVVMPNPLGSMKMGTVRDVLYVPDLRLQLIDGRFVPQEAVPQPWTLQFEAARGFHGGIERYQTAFAVERSDERVCILSNFYSRNFFHWLTEEMVKAAVLEWQGFSGRYVLHGLPAFTMDFLALLGVPRSRMVPNIAGPTVYGSAVYVSAVDAWSARVYPSAYHLLRDRLREAASAVATDYPDRIWMERIVGVNNQSRGVVNTDEVYALIAKYEFERVDMAALPAVEQVAAASRAVVIAGVHGAAFGHAVLLRPGSAVVECYAPTFVNPGILDLCLINDLDYSMLVHENAYAGYPHGDDVMINCTHLEVVLKRLAGREKT